MANVKINTTNTKANLDNILLFPSKWKVSVTYVKLKIVQTFFNMQKSSTNGTKSLYFRQNTHNGQKISRYINDYWNPANE